MRAEDSVRQVRAGAREGTLPFSQSRQAAQALVEAEQLAAAGNTDKALHKVRRALHLEPHNAQAIALREQLVNKQDNWPTGSLLEDIVNGAAENRAQQNILQHGWRGDISQADTQPEVDHRVASDHPAVDQNPGQNTGRNGVKYHNSTAGSNFNNGHAGHSSPNNTNTYAQGVANPGRDFGDATIPTPSYDSTNWWTSPEFDVFMVAWSAASALEQNEEFDPANRWWTTDQFRDFFGAYQVAQAQPGGENWSQSPEFQQFMQDWQSAAERERYAAANAGDNSTDNDWWHSPEFAQFMAAWADAAAQEQYAAASAADTGTENNWWQSPEFGQFMNAWAEAAATEQTQYAQAAEWWKSEAFREFMAAFNTAVEKADALDNTEGNHDAGVQTTPSDTGYTNVPGDNED